MKVLNSLLRTYSRNLLNIKYQPVWPSLSFLRNVLLVARISVSLSFQPFCLFLHKLEKYELK